MKLLPTTYSDYIQCTFYDAGAHAKLTQEIERIKHALSQGYATDYAAINLPAQKDNLDALQTFIDEKKALNIDALFVIGIGGSNLGTKAVYEALYGTHANELRPGMKAYFADTVDTHYMHDLIKIARGFLNQGKHILLNVISKSGTTTETIANAELLIAVLIEYFPQTYHDYVVVTTDKDSPLEHLAHERKIQTLEIPKKVGGRYSVFSNVGLFPLGMLGVDLKELLEGAYAAVVTGTDSALEQNIPAQMASALFSAYKAGFIIHDTFLFSNELESIGKWYRQLMGESIGKEFDRRGKKVDVGITPTVSLGSVDLHSVGQLYLGGPHDKITTFITIGTVGERLQIPHYKDFDKLVPYIQGVSLEHIMHAIFHGVQTAYTKQNLPWMQVTLPEVTPFYIGQLLQLQMLQMIYLGYLLEVDPFDQPHVELYKKETKRLLAHGQ